MKDKKLTRKEFLLSIGSIMAVFAVGKLPSLVKNSVTNFKKDNSYGNYAYGGSKKSDA